MIALAFLCVAGVTNFVEQPMPGLEVGSRTFPAAIASTNVRSADIDEDGQNDLVLPSGVWLQRTGGFPKATAIPLPNRRHFETIYAEEGHLYGSGTGEVACFSLYGNQWRNEWIVPFNSVNSPLFHDLDSDGHAELILPEYDRLLIYRVRVSASAQLLAELQIFPPLRPQLESVRNLWASPSRPSVEATRTRDFRIALDGPNLTTREVLRVGSRRVEFRFATYTFQWNSDGTTSAPQTASWSSMPLPDVMIPYRSLRTGETMFAGARPARPESIQLGESLTEVLLGKRDDAALQTIRTKSATTYLALADFDGDGDEDLLTQTNSLTAGPPREVIMRLASAHTVRHSFAVHVQNAEGRFDPQPRQTLAVDIDLGSSALEDGPRWLAYRQGALTCSSADYDGDRRADIAAWIDAERIGVWFNHEGLFQKTPDTILSVSKGSGFVPADVDHDGRADIAILPVPGSDAAPIVWFSR